MHWNKAYFHLALVSLFSTACADHDFSGENGKARGSAENPPGEQATPATANVVPDTDKGTMAAPQSEPDSDRARELPPEPKEPESPEPNTAEDGAKCRQGPGNSRAIKVAGRNHDEVIDIDDGAAVVRVTGTNNVVTIRIPDGGEADLQALCIFVAGDGNRVRLEVAGKLAGLAYVARGNQSVLDVSVAATGQMGAASLDLAGNQAKVKVSGDGTYSCPKSPTLAGNAPQIECAERRESPAER